MLTSFVDRTRSLLARLSLPPFLRRAWHKLRRPLLWLLLTLYFGFVVLALILRFAILPHIADYRSDIEETVSKAIHLPVSIASIQGDWQGFRPRLVLHGLNISDKAGRPALGFDSVEAVLGWSSLWHFEARLHRLEIDGPKLNIRREADGQILVAGLPMQRNDSQDTRLSDWILAQGQIVIRDASLQWDDAMRQAPTLTLQKVNLNLQSSGSRHRIGFTAEPPTALAARIDIRADLKGRDFSDLASWKGQVYTELDYADLSGWHAWFDYPLPLPRGSGGLRLWLDFAKGQISGLTADLALADVQLRLGRKLPMLDLQQLHGRISASRDGDTYTFVGRKLDLVTKATKGSPAGLSLGPLDFSATMEFDEQGQPLNMEARCNSLDLGKLDALASYLPLPQDYEKLLDQLDLEGRIDGLVTRWDGKRKRYAIKGDFHELGISPYAGLPGVRKFSGSIDGTEKGGTITLDSRDATLALPGVFPEPEIALQKLGAKLRWQRDGSQYDLNIDTLNFSNQDADGSLQGSYHGKLGEAGNIDLTGQLTRADGTAVWRYLPSVVNQDARSWLKQGITSGQSKDVKLTLKGDLDKFPFKNGGGTFKVLIKAQNASVRPGPGWPEIRGIDGDVAFIGAGMHIEARKGQILGATLADVKADIADLDASDDQALVITGKAKGPTQEFLGFIEASPVGERIGHFTAPMSASGNGELDLKLVLLLNNLDRSTVDGNYLFDNNRLQPDPNLPPLTEAKGRLGFTDSSITLKDGRANMLGAPLTLNINTDKDGAISVLADGQFSVPALRKLYPMPLFDQLAGSGRWKGRFAIRKNDVDIRISSDLVGLSSTLPEPFNKTAGSAMDFRIERRTLPPDTRTRKNGDNSKREVQELALGKLLRGQFIRSNGELQRGYLAVGSGADTARLQDRNILLTANLARIDIDYWRRMLDTGKAGSNGSKDDTALPFTQIDIRAAETLVMNRSLQDVRLTAQQSGNAWKGDFRSKGVSAAIEWTPGQNGNPGRIVGKIPQLSIPEPNRQLNQIVADSGQDVRQLPALALVIDKLSIHGKDWGSVTLDADNRSGYWNFKAGVNNPDGTLNADGRWKPDTTTPDTQLNFKLHANNMEKLLARMGYVDAVRDGKADFEGSLSWNGSPFGFDYPSLNGTLKVDMQKSQFKKLEPGLGRLLGILSLQSLPRRLTLDFRDIFSEGFAFDKITGDIAIKLGIMDTQNLAIVGPAASIAMNGKVDLLHETQDLRVRVQPALSETVAMGVLLANPAVGLATWLAQKVLRNPIDKIFAFEYSVTGKWDDPVVKKIETGRDINKELLKEAEDATKIDNKDAKDKKP